MPSMLPCAAAGRRDSWSAGGPGAAGPHAPASTGPPTECSS